ARFWSSSSSSYFVFESDRPISYSVRDPFHVPTIVGGLRKLSQTKNATATKHTAPTAPTAPITRLSSPSPLSDFLRFFLRPLFFFFLGALSAACAAAGGSPTRVSTGAGALADSSPSRSSTS